MHRPTEPLAALPGRPSVSPATSATHGDIPTPTRCTAGGGTCISMVGAAGKRGGPAAPQPGSGRAGGAGAGINMQRAPLAAGAGVRRVEHKASTAARRKSPIHLFDCSDD